MVSWGNAFKTALKIVFMSIGWYILGLIVIIAGWAGGAATALTNPNILRDPLGILGVLGGAVIVSIIGGAIIYLGVIASALKYSVELIADEVGRGTAALHELHPAPPLVPASTPVEVKVVSPTEACRQCGKKMPHGSQFCEKCGSRLTEA
jgi:ribosomal protein L40E